MIKKILLLCFLLTTVLFAQQYSNDKYEKYVGTKLSKYPLTVTGLKKAINALDSGVVYISYPGLWDTTGLGTIPNKIALQGYLFGNMVYSFNAGANTYILNNLGNVLIGDTTVYNPSDTKFSVLRNLPYSGDDYWAGRIEMRTKGSAYSDWVGINGLAAGVFFDADNDTNWKVARAFGCGVNMNSDNSTMAVMRGINLGLNILGISNIVTDATALYMSNSFDSLNTVTNYKAIHVLSTDANKITATNHFGLYIDSGYKNYVGGSIGIGSASQDSTLTVTGSGHFTSNVQIDGTKLGLPNIPSDSTSVTTGQLWFNNSTGQIHRKF